MSSIHLLGVKSKMPRSNSFSPRVRERERTLAGEIRSIVRGIGREKSEEAEGESDPDDGHRLSRGAQHQETRGRKKGRREGGGVTRRLRRQFYTWSSRPRYILLPLLPAK